MNTILEFTTALSEICRERDEKYDYMCDCLTCCYRVFCYTPPKGWTKELVETVVRLINLHHTEQKMISHMDMDDHDHQPHRNDDLNKPSH